MCINKYLLIMVTLASAVVYAQSQIFFVASSNSMDATGYNNSHKIAPQYGQGPNDTINVVFHSSDSVYFVFTNDGGQSWSTPGFLYLGKHPSIDVDHMGFRYLSWQSLDTTTNTYEIYYDCIDDWCLPMNISQSVNHSILPDLVVDSNSVVHIIWVEEVAGYNQIYYRTVWQNVLGDTARISDFGSNEATYTHPSISIFQPNNRIYTIWECYDSLCYSPYQIHSRYKENDAWSMISSLAHYLPMRHPSLDYAHTFDTLSFCYEDSTSGNMEATFYGGNGGGYLTPGYSTYPVVSTVGSTWSYLFWQEDSAGCRDILYHLYYEFAGWTQGSLRDYFSIQKSVGYPSASGAYLVWTQGDDSPYSVYFADFGYPIGIQGNEQLQKTNISARPNPFSRTTEIRYETLNKGLNKLGRTLELKIYNSNGQLVRNFSTQSPMIGHPLSVKWSGENDAGYELPDGVYFSTLEDMGEKHLLKIVKLHYLHQTINSNSGSFFKVAVTEQYLSRESSKERRRSSRL
jgi:hypothetical protein